MVWAAMMLRSGITTHSTSKTWWWGIFCYLADQSHIAVFRTWNKLVPTKKMTMHSIVEQIFYGLIGKSDKLIKSTEVRSILTPQRLRPPQEPAKKRVRLNPTKADEARFIATTHMPKSLGKSRNCVLCWQNTKKQKKSSIYCSACDVVLCVKSDRDCFWEYHQKPQ
jgi:hypothetical protein